MLKFIEPKLSIAETVNTVGEPSLVNNGFLNDGGGRLNKLVIHKEIVYGQIILLVHTNKFSLGSTNDIFLTP